MYEGVAVQEMVAVSGWKEEGGKEENQKNQKNQKKAVRWLVLMEVDKEKKSRGRYGAVGIRTAGEGCARVVREDCHVQSLLAA